MTARQGPLAGLRIIELAGIGPGPFCGMMLADLGAEVVRVERPGGNPTSGFAHRVLFRSRTSIAVNLKDPDGVDVIRRLADDADGIFEGYRPGVVERMGLGPDDLLARNPRLVYGRMTGWGQDGPLAHTAGHDVNYLALSGALSRFRRAGQPPLFPMNVVADFGGGGMLLAYGMLAGILSAQRTGVGQVVDAAMLDGVAALMAMHAGLVADGYVTAPGEGMLDSGAHFYEVYTTADGQHVSLGAIEPHFYAELLTRLDLSDHEIAAHQGDTSRWSEFKDVLAARIGELTRAELDERLLGSDACYAPVLDFDAAPDHPHNAARGTWIRADGVQQHQPAPRFSVTTPDAPVAMTPVGTDTRRVVDELGLDTEALLASGAIAEAVG